MSLLLSFISKNKNVVAKSLCSFGDSCLRIFIFTPFHTNLRFMKICLAVLKKKKLNICLFIFKIIMVKIISYICRYFLTKPVIVIPKLTIGGSVAGFIIHQRNFFSHFGFRQELCAIRISASSRFSILKRTFAPIRYVKKSFQMQKIILNLYCGHTRSETCGLSCRYQSQAMVALTV